MYSVLPFVHLFKSKDWIPIMGIQHVLKWCFPMPCKHGKGEYTNKGGEMACSGNGGQHWKHLYHNFEVAGMNAIFKKKRRNDIQCNSFPKIEDN